MDFDADPPLNGAPDLWETRLAALAPALGALSSSRLLFEAGAAEARRRARTTRTLWGAAALLPAVLSTFLYLQEHGRYLQERGRAHYLGVSLARTERRLDALERRSDALATARTDPSFAPTQGGYFRLRSRWLSEAPEGASESENLDAGGSRADDRVGPPLSSRLNPRSLEL